MVQELSSSPLFSLPSLAGSLSQAEAVGLQEAQQPDQAAPESAQPAAQTAPAPAATAAAFPAVLEEFAYRYQLDLGFAFSISSTSGSTFQPASQSAPALPSPALPGAVESGSRRAVALTAFQQVRSFHARSFLQHSDRFASQFPQPTADKVRSASQSVARAFRLDFSLNVSFLQQFARQRGALSEYGEDTFNSYLGLSDTLSLSSGEQAKNFFDHVDTLLTGAKEQLQESIPAFLQEMSAKLGLSEKDTQALGDLLGDHIEAFFAETAGFLDQAESRIAALGSAPAAPANPELPTAAPDSVPA